MFQDQAINKITEELMKISLNIKSGTDRINTITLAGPTGTGKSEIVSQLKHLLGMDPGYVNAHRSVRVSSWEFLGIVNEEKNRIVDRIVPALCRAISFVEAYKGTTFFHKPLILVEIDHVEDFAGPALLTVLEGLQDRGSLTASDGTVFNLPGDFSLLVILVYTCETGLST